MDVVSPGGHVMKKLSVELLVLVGAGLFAYGVLKTARTNGLKAIAANASQPEANSARFDFINQPVRSRTNKTKKWQWAERN